MKRQYFNFIILSMMIISCVDRFRIPNDINQNNSGNFGAGDTSFLQLSPVWNSAHGLSQPVEISIAQDGRVYVADAGVNSILVFDQNGNSPTGFDALKGLVDSETNGITPIDVDIDKKMNVFFIDGSQRIFLWNQNWNEAGINKVSVSASFLHMETGVVVIDTVGSATWLSYLNNLN
jgi:DNA-binding beta-propeller fold protein YncE